MKRVLVADIFGNTDALQALAAEIPGEVEIIDPYSGTEMGFATERAAYQCFSSTVDIGGYAAIVHQYLKRQNQLVELIGFSAGGSAIWQCAADDYAGLVSGALCFYSSQIRHNAELQPSFPVQLVFPQSEAHFDVNVLMDQLAKTENVGLHQADYAHGFMNRYSLAFSLEGYRSYLNQLCESLSHHPVQKVNFVAVR